MQYEKCSDIRVYCVEGVPEVEECMRIMCSQDQKALKCNLN